MLDEIFAARPFRQHGRLELASHVELVIAGEDDFDDLLLLVPLGVSLRQMRVNRFEACGIVGYRLTFVWRMASEYQNDRHTSEVVRGRAATV